MRIILASSNKGKIEEFKKMLPNNEVKAFSEILGDIDIIEDGTTFQQNAIKKAKTIYNELEKINYKDFIVISDDSGISVPILDNQPGIFSARYAGVNANDKQNNSKLISQLKENNVTETIAFYTACVCMIYNNHIYSVHGWMYGKVINQEIGTNGFGYDPMFIPKGFDKTLGELDLEIKKEFSHRSKALTLAKQILKVINPN